MPVTERKKESCEMLATFTESLTHEVVSQTRITGSETRQDYHLKGVLRFIRKQEKDNLPDEGEKNECRERK